MKGRGKGVPPQSARSGLPAGGVPSFVFIHLSRTPIVDFAHYRDHDILPIFIDRYRVIEEDRGTLRQEILGYAMEVDKRMLF
jgi:hypothetical protein